VVPIQDARTRTEYSPLSYRHGTNDSPQVVSRSEWLTARKDLLAKEKAVLRAQDAFAAQMRTFPMVQLSKPYTFTTPSGTASLLDLFSAHKQLIVYHLMFDPDDEAACPSCSYVVDHVPHLSHLAHRNTAFVAVSRAPLSKIEAFKKRMGWTFPWVSSFGGDFNYDLHVSLDESVAPVEYNFKDKETLLKEGNVYATKGEQPGLSIFYREGEDIFHSYSTYARGVEVLMGTYRLLDLTPLGRQEDGPGPKMDFLHHDKYDEV
jgi:predicted dithiol-disulfide oxidoreductase (DUF899 family)